MLSWKATGVVLLLKYGNTNECEKRRLLPLAYQLSKGSIKGISNKKGIQLQVDGN